MFNLDGFWNVVGQIVIYGGGGVAIAYALFTKFGDKWLEAKFEERLASYRHAQQKEIEHLRFQINALLDRASKLNQREFEVIPEAWSKINEAYAHTAVFVSPAQMYPNLATMKPEQFEEFVRELDFSEWEKTELRSGADKNKCFRERLFWHRLNEAKVAARESNIFLAKNSIFLPRDLKEVFDRINTMIWNALDEHELSRMYEGMPNSGEKQKQLSQEGAPALAKLEKQLHSRLWNSEGTKSSNSDVSV